MRGLNTKLANIFNNSFDSDFDVLVFTETWLRENVLDSEIMASNFQIYRRDRLGKAGGGVLIAVRSSYTSNLIVTLNLFV